MVSKLKEIVEEEPFSEALSKIQEVIEEEGIGKEDKEYIISKLEDVSGEIRALAWYAAVILLERNELDREEIIERKALILSIIQSGDVVDDDIFYHTMENILSLVRDGIITKEDKKYLIDLLKTPDEKSRSWGWSVASHILTYQNEPILEENDILENIEYFNELLKSKDMEVRGFAWAIALDLVEKKVLNKLPIEGLIELLKIDDLSLRYFGWKTALSLVENKVIPKEEVLKYKQYLDEIMKRSPGWITEGLREQLKKLGISMK